MIELQDLRRSFGETQALKGIALSVHPGEILGVAGPNGAGKTTLMRILAGEDAADSGRILLDRQPVRARNLLDLVAVVHQEPQLWPNMTVGENLLVGRERSSLRVPQLSDAERSILDDFSIQAYRDTPLERCPVAVRQRAEIARAVARSARLFLFDEPNSALTERQSDALFEEMHRLSESGRMVVLVSHRLAEVVAHCHRVVVVRDGRIAAELIGDALSEEALARELVTERGADDHRIGAGPSPAGGAPVFSVRGLSSRGGEFAGVSLTISAGEVVAVTGVEGSGARELVGRVGGGTAASGGIAYVSGDRKATLFHNMSVAENVTARLGRRDIATTGGWLRLARIRQVAEEWIRRYRIRTLSALAPITSLSGGNQQKVALAAAVARRPRLLAVEEPTRGVDIGSKAEIYRFLHEFARAGNGVLVYCTEVTEIFELATRVVVMSRGTVTGSLAPGDHRDEPALAEAIVRASTPIAGEGTNAGTHHRRNS